MALAHNRIQSYRKALDAVKAAEPAGGWPPAMKRALTTLAMETGETYWNK